VQVLARAIGNLRQPLEVGFAVDFQLTLDDRLHRCAANQMNCSTPQLLAPCTLIPSILIFGMTLQAHLDLALNVRLWKTSAGAYDY
jgi:hypothetical protein